jgi:hypothetical protein
MEKEGRYGGLKWTDYTSDLRISQKPTNQTNTMTKAKQIEAVIIAVSKYHGLDPVSVLKSFSSTVKPMVRARLIIWYHMYQCGMSFDAIARVFKLSCETVQKSITLKKSSLTEEEMILIATLPKIENSIQLTQCKH